MSITLPGRFGKVGTLVMEPGSEYTVVHADVGMYLINGWLGLGWRFGSDAGATRSH